MPKIQIVTGQGTEQHGQALAQAIEQKMGVEVGVASPTTNSNPRDMERLGRILDTLAVLRETESTLKAQALHLIAENPSLIQGSQTLTLDQRIENTVSNRANIRTTYGDSRPIHPPEQMILAGAAATLGGEAQHLGSLVYLSAQHPSVTEGTFREGLNHPEQSTIELGRQIQARIDRPTEPANEYEPGDD